MREYAQKKVDSTSTRTVIVSGSILKRSGIRNKLSEVIVISTVLKLFNFLNRNDGTLRSQVLRSSFWVGFSSFIAWGLNFVRSVVLARILVPEVYGLMAICTLVLDGTEVFTQTGFGAALIHRQEKVEEAKNTTFTITAIRGFILSLLVFFIAPIVANYYERQELTNIIRILSLAFIIRGFSNINLVILRKELNFKTLTFFEIIITIFNCVTAIILVYFLRNIWALVISAIITSFMHTIISFIIIPGRPRFEINFQIFKELFSYGKFITGAVIVTFILTQGDNALVGKLLGMEALGYYVLAFGLANLPWSYITGLTSKVMFPVYSKIQTDIQALQQSYLEVLKFIAIFAIPSAAGIGILAPEIVRIIYTAKWMPAVGALQVLCVFGAIRALTASTGSIFSAVGKPNIIFYNSTARLIIMVAIIYPLTHKYGIVGTSYAILIPIIMELLIEIIYISKTIKLKVSSILMTIFYPICSAIIMMILIVFCKKFITVANINSLIFLVFIGAISYLSSYIIIDRKALKMLLTNYAKLQT